MQHDSRWLRDYLVSSVEDPRINLQSIFSRHFLIRSALWKMPCSVPNPVLELLMDHECRFSAVMGWLVPAVAAMRDRDEAADLLHALDRGIQNTETLEIPGFVLQTFSLLPAQTGEFYIPNYLQDSLQGVNLVDGSGRLPDWSVNIFMKLWAQGSQQFKLTNPEPSQERHTHEYAIRNTQYAALSALEPGCGSANDYRFVEAAGLTPLLRYSGIDLCEKNIENARLLFPSADFRIGNVFEIDAADKAFDVCFFHDLLEHLSMDGLKTAVKEICRVTRHSICAGFFQMHRMEDHVIREMDEYHLNTLSVSRICELFEANGFAATAISVAGFLKERFRCEFTHNPNAYTLVLTRSEQASG